MNGLNSLFFNRSAIALLLALGATAGAQAANSPENLIAWRPALTSSAQPNLAYLKQAKEQKYDMVINLAPPQSMGSIENEGGIIGSQGLVYLNIPVAFGNPTLRDFEVFSAAVKNSGGRNLLVHCQANFRASSFVLLYRAIYEDAPIGELVAKLTSIWVPDEVWKKFIVATLKQYGKESDVF